MTFVGCDLHTRKQQVAVLDTRTGEVSEHQLAHDGTAVEEFYAVLPRPVTVGIESTGYAVWFHTLMQRLGHPLLVGDAAKIRAMVVRKTKTDRRDALHLLDLLDVLASRPRHLQHNRPAEPAAAAGDERRFSLQVAHGDASKAHFLRGESPHERLFSHWASPCHGW